MTNILIPLNKSVLPLYKHYPEFITKVAEFLALGHFSVDL